MHLDVEIIQGLIAEQQVSTDQLEFTCIWPHPWEHYPFFVDGKRKWLRYIDLEVEQKKLISNTISEIEKPKNNYLHKTESKMIPTSQFQQE